MTVVRRTLAKPEPASTEVVKLHPRVQLVHSGSRMLNLMLSGKPDGGWPSGRIINVVGDRSTSKTLIAVEACINYSRLSSAGQIRYVETEAAFDLDYQQSLGLPKAVQPVTDIETVEAWYEDMEKFLKTVNPKFPSLYVLDSLDALSDSAEMDREIDKGSYGASKARKLSEMFRRIVKRVEQANCTLFIISQVRDKLNVTYGETKTRSGGRALDFYCSQIIWLSEIEKIKRTVKGADRHIGIWVKAVAKKNKLANPFRTVDIAVLFGYGIHDAMSMLDWLKSNKNTEEDWMAQERNLVSIMKEGNKTALAELENHLALAVTKHWSGIEQELKPKVSKY